jgi:REP element-mobilizing transposase RayT
MRQPRLKVPADRPVGYYHCLSRVVDRRFIFGEPEKEHFVKLMREYEAFCEVQVLTHSVMSNHFHILLEVPRRPVLLPDAEAILAKLKNLSGHNGVKHLRQQVELLRKANDHAAEAQLLTRYHDRMWDVSAYMKLVKQRFTQWYNRRNDRKGTLWEERFRSVLVEGSGEALLAMAAYIDLNSVRARIVPDPKDYRWSGYGAAVAGDEPARLGLQAIVRALPGGQEASPSRALELYRMHLYRVGDEQRESVGPDGQTERGALAHEEVMKVLAAKGRLPLASYVRCRVRYFSDGAVLGSREFVNGIFTHYRRRFGAQRKDGARRVQGLETELYVLRDLRLGVFG